MSSRTRTAFATLLRHHRVRRGLSQLALATRVETTTRHLSYLENGRSRPGRDVVLRLGDALELPLRTRNELLVAAGLAPEFPTSTLDSPVLAPYRKAVVRLLGTLQPFPAFVIDPIFQLEEANAAGHFFLSGAPRSDRINLIETFLAPGPARSMVENFPEVAWSWYARFVRATANIASPEVNALAGRLENHLKDVPRPLLDANGPPVICPTFRIDGTLIRTIGMTMRFGPSRDVMLEELSVDVLYPRDEVAERFFRSLADGSS